ncbi:MAG: glutaminyl-peptide cyclotransferase, partial [Acidobacteria bacterium]|nr:glutaminyl-peptide cyclotransferase [Acidobacteriota bacterium]
MMHYLIIIFSSVVLLFLGAFNTCEPTVRGQQSGENQQAERITAPARVQNLTYEVVNVYPHDPNAFTQGLVFH